ncbi:RICIN domain-containing protein [Erythrobacter sp. JK5]|uniref:RICIN domain-containing protein n=1 Tax=Erythrobacter sp. JK5 TaxID=2829500 RepID=UPI001BAD09B7|nr:RICIN domain-containing protein [Erythrobacter sp. JK5]QUL37639.1 ricin-type beta-trefoil lectin domain protein [Erythrobacter sp. JK5]
MARGLSAMCIAALGIAALNVSTPAMADRVQNIDYEGGGRIVHYRDRTSLPKDLARICLKNQTGQPKRVFWRRINSDNAIKMLVQKGQQSCVTMPKDQRVTFDFQDRSVSVKTTSMNMHDNGGTVTLFHWVADAPLPTSCGGIGEKPCSLWERFPSCEPGLYEVLFVSCEAKEPALSEIIKASQDHQRMLTNLSNCLNTPQRRGQIRAAVDSSNQALASEATSGCVTQSVLHSLSVPRPDGQSFRSLSIGVGTGGQAIAGVSGEVGLVFSLTPGGTIHDQVRFYASGDYSVGVGLGFGADIILGLSRDPLQVGISEKWSQNYAGVAGIGGGVAYVFDYGQFGGPNPATVTLNDFSGIAVSAGVGLGIDVGSIHRSRTEIFGPRVAQQGGGHLTHVGSGHCLDIWGVTARIARCASTSTNKFQGWTIDRGFIKGAKGRCLDVAQNRAGGTVTIAPCRSTSSKQFQEWRKDGNQIRNVASGMCLETTANRIGSNVVINTCSPGKAAQRWE